MEWISVEERLPKKNEEYIVCGVGFNNVLVTTLEWRRGRWFSDVYQNYVEMIKITHWMPLPEPPKQ